jgi:hypothetical protein
VFLASSASIRSTYTLAPVIDSSPGRTHQRAAPVQPWPPLLQLARSPVGCRSWKCIFETCGRQPQAPIQLLRVPRLRSTSGMDWSSVEWPTSFGQPSCCPTFKPNQRFRKPRPYRRVHRLPLYLYHRLTSLLERYLDLLHRRGQRVSISWRWI